MCESAEQADCVRFISLNDSVVDSGDLRRYSGGRLVEWMVCGRRKIAFCRATLDMGRRSDRIICGHIAQLPLAWAASLLRPKLSYYLVAHGIEVWRPLSLLEGIAARRARRVWCVSEFTRQQIIKYGRISPDRAVVLSNALDPYLEPSLQAPSPDGPPVVLTVSRLTVADSYKGISHLISAMPAVRAQIPGTRLRIVGRGDGLRSLQDLAGKLQMSDAVEFAGYRSDVELRQEFSGCRLFALPSEKEGFGLVYLEAMAHGRPCLGARSAGVPEVITDETGVLVEYGNVPAIAAAIVSSLRREWRTEALIERAEHFSYLRFKERFTSLIQA
jgi:phosphatidylinositol alpha-1,6-mannosyltransferase